RPNVGRQGTQYAASGLEADRGSQRDRGTRSSQGTTPGGRAARLQHARKGRRDARRRASRPGSPHGCRGDLGQPPGGGDQSDPGCRGHLSGQAPDRERPGGLPRCSRRGARNSRQMNDTSTIQLIDLHLDALTELVNLGVSNAAMNLSEMIREEIVLSVPRVSLVTREEAIEILQGRDAKQLIAIHQEFEGDIRGRALLIFPEAKSLELIRALVGPDLPLEDIMELEQEALAETGNVLLNACLSTIANSLQRNLRISLPEVIRGDGVEFFRLTSSPAAGDTVLFIYINFSVEHRDIQGYLAMLLDIPSLAILQTLLAEYIERTAG